MKKSISAFFIFLVVSLSLNAKDYTVSSPSGNISAVVKVDGSTSMSIYIKDVKVMEDCKIAMHLSDSTTLGDNATIREYTRGTRPENINAPFDRQSSFQAS